MQIILTVMTFQHRFITAERDEYSGEQCHIDAFGKRKPLVVTPLGGHFVQKQFRLKAVLRTKRG